MADSAPQSIPNFLSLLKQRESQPMFFQSLIEKLSLNQDPLEIEGTFFPRQTVVTALTQWGSTHISPFDPQKVLNNNFDQISTFVTEQLAPKAQEEIEGTVVPLAKIREWQKSQEWLLQQAATLDDPKRLGNLYALNLEKQIKILEQAHKQVYAQAMQMAPESWPPEQKIQFAREISQGLVEQTVIRQLAGRKINQDSLRGSLQKLVDESPVLSIGLNQEQVQALAQQVGPGFLPPGPNKPDPHLEQIAEARKRIIQAQTIITPTYEESRVKLEAALQKELGFSEKKAQEFCWKLEANLQQKPTDHTKKEDYPLISTAKAKKAVEASLNTGDYLALGSKKKTAADLADKLLPLVQTHGIHLVLAQHPLEWQGLSPQAVKWAIKLTKKGIKPQGQVVTAQAIENLLRGLSAENVSSELTELQAQKANPAKIAKLAALHRQMQVIDPKDPKNAKVLPWRLRQQIRRTQRKAEFLGFLDKINPLGFKFWQHWFPQPATWLKERTQQIQDQISWLKLKKYNFFQKANPLSLRNRSIRQYKRQVRHLRLWGKVVNRIVKLPGLNKNKKLRRFLFHLPQKLKAFRLSSVLGVAFGSVSRFISTQTGKLLIKIATSDLGKKIFKGAFSSLLQGAGETVLKEGLTKGTTWLLGSTLAALGLSATGIGAVFGGALAVVGTALTFAKYAFKLAFSKEGQEIIKKLAAPVVSLIAGGLHFALTFLLAHKFALLGAFFGSFLGPAGMAAGGFLGYLADTQLVPFLGKAGAGLGVGNTSILSQVLGAGTSVSAAAGSGLLGSLAVPAAAVPLTIVSVSGFSMIQMLTTSSAFVGPAELGSSGTGIREYVQDSVLRVAKTASPTQATANQQISYQLEISSQEGGLKNVVIDDNPDLSSLEIIAISPQPTDESNMVWNIDQMLEREQISQDFSSAGATLTINYTAKVKAGIGQKDKIYNQVTVTAQNQAGEKITRKAYAIINSDCQDVVTKAAEIMNDLIMASNSQCQQINPGCVSWILENRWEGYLSGYNCPISPDIRQQTNPLSTSGGCVVCNDLVTMAYLLTSHPNPHTTGWENTASLWKNQGILIIENGRGDISQLSSGDIVYFDVKRTADDGSTYLDKFSHVGVIAGVTSTGIYTWEANTPNNGQRYYSYAGDSFVPLGGVVFVNAIGNTCQE